jgi:molecular chaperone GrpE
LLPALDSLERAIQFSASNTVSYKQGVEMTLKQLCDGFKSLGVTEIEAQGAAFNPDMHNAVMHVEDEAQGDSVVTEVFQKGYAIGERVIRHSVVKVAN